MDYLNKSYLKHFALFLGICMLSILPQMVSNKAHAIEIESNVDSSTVPVIIKTPFDLYLSAKEAHTALIKNPSIVLIDVRDPVEITYIGHPESMDANIPMAVISRNFEPNLGLYQMTPNENFVVEVSQFMERSGFDKSHPVIVACREGIRAAAAAKLLHKAGYENVWNQIEGFEGSIDLESGRRSAEDGWINARLPYRYKIKPGAEWQPIKN